MINMPSLNDRVRYTLEHKDQGRLIIEEPIGWKEDQKEFARHNKYHGIMVKFSAGLIFIEKGAEFIKTIMTYMG